jgi:hypothetical protein
MGEGAGDGLPGDLPGFGGSDMPGDIRGGVGGGLPDGMGGEIPGGAGFGGIGGWDNPFGDPGGGSGMPGGMGGSGGMGGPGGDFPGRPGQGEMMDGPGGGGGGGTSRFWSWNFNPEQQSRFQHSRELTEMNESQQDLNYDENWEAGPEIGEKDMIDPFSGRYEEWGEPTSSDYDEAEKDQENFVQAQIDFEEEQAKQKEAKEKRESDDDDDDDDNGGDDNQQSAQAQSAAVMTTPDGGDGEGGGGGATVHEAGRFNWQRLGGLLVFDPPRPDMGTGDQASSYDPGGISDTAYTPDGTGGGAAVRPIEAGPKVDPSHVTDPVPNQEKDQANQQNQ